MICSRCQRPIGGDMPYKDDIEMLTAISDANKTTAHFWCYYPQGVADRTLELPRWAMQRVATLSPERARFFTEAQS